jgi:putative membrane protein
MVAVAAAAAALSLVRPENYFTWLFEIALGAIGILALTLLAPRFRFSALVYRVAAVHFVVLAIGAHYTYEHEPLFDWLKAHFHLSRNYADRVGHFFQGLTPALITREVLLRRSNVRGWLLVILGMSVPIAFSAIYEILEWLWVVTFYPAVDGPEWLGMQGDRYDTQGDMLMAVCGAMVAVSLLRPWHDRSINGLSGKD